MFLAKKCALLALLVCLAVLTVPTRMETVGAQAPPVICVHEARYGLMGLARLQVARLNVVNLTPPDPIQPPDPVHPPDPAFPPDPCHFAIAFLTTGNQFFVNAAGLPIVIEGDLRPGQSAFVELTSADAFRGSRELRMPFRATGLLTHSSPPPDDDRPDACRAVVPTLEIYDALTGRSQVVANPLEIFGFNPQPEPPGLP